MTLGRRATWKKGQGKARAGVSKEELHDAENLKTVKTVSVVVVYNSPIICKSGTQMTCLDQQISTLYSKYTISYLLYHIAIFSSYLVYILWLGEFSEAS